ncbi:hypothetical protein NL676_022827 [Syzygium grande]|nr:hypothetical protein NL676_022827 [Syzygium grande]
MLVTPLPLILPLCATHFAPVDLLSFCTITITITVASMSPFHFVGTDSLLYHPICRRWPCCAPILAKATHGKLSRVARRSLSPATLPSPVRDQLKPANGLPTSHPLAPWQSLKQ